MTVELLTPKKAYTIEEYAALPDNGRVYELVGGELVEMAGPSGQHGDVVNFLGSRLRVHVDSKELGRVFSGASCVLNTETNTARVPDIAFVKAGRIPAKFKGPVPVAPDLAIEVISPSDSAEEIQNKVEDYQAAGVLLIWSIYLPGSFVLVRRLGDFHIKLLNIDDELDGTDIVPNFKLLVGKLFE
jgi:Uma2 family endonuclease